MKFVDNNSESETIERAWSRVLATRMSYWAISLFSYLIGNNEPSKLKHSHISLEPPVENTSLHIPGIPPSLFEPICHPLVESVTKQVDGYFLQHWNFPNERAREKFVAAGFSRVTCLYFPKSLDDRIHFACRLLTVLFLIDGGLCYTLNCEHMCLCKQISSTTCPWRTVRHTTRS